jgi:cell division topological specificity factor
MNFLNILMPKKKSAKIAKERLQIIISHERKAGNQTKDFVPQLRKELVAVISKYVDLTEEQINIEVKQDGSHSTIEMNVVVPNLEKEAEMA